MPSFTHGKNISPATNDLNNRHEEQRNCNTGKEGKRDGKWMDLEIELTLTVLSSYIIHLPWSWL